MSVHVLYFLVCISTNSVKNESQISEITKVHRRDQLSQNVQCPLGP